MGIAELIVTGLVALICYLAGPKYWKPYKEGFAEGVKEGFRK